MRLRLKGTVRVRSSCLFCSRTLHSLLKDRIIKDGAKSDLISELNKLQMRVLQIYASIIEMAGERVALKIH